MTDAAILPAWRCTSCGLLVRFAPGFALPTAAPDGWTYDCAAGALTCAICNRERAVEAALIEAGLDAFDRGAAAVRKRAIAAFELRRDRSRSNVEIARTAGCSYPTVAAARRELAAAEMVGSST